MHGTTVKKRVGMSKFAFTERTCQGQKRMSGN